LSQYPFGGIKLSIYYLLNYGALITDTYEEFLPHEVYILIAPIIFLLHLIPEIKTTKYFSTRIKIILFYKKEKTTV
jgi:hypothetical protein